MRVNSIKPVPPSPSAIRVAATAAPAKSTAPGDTLSLKRAEPPAAKKEPFKMPAQTWIGVGSAGLAVALAAGGLISVAGVAALPVLATAAALEGVLALTGLGLTRGWGERADAKPHDPSKADWSLMAIMARTTGAIGLGATLVATALGTSAVAMGAGGLAVFAWPAAVVATGLVGVLAWWALKQPNPLGRK